MGILSKLELQRRVLIGEIMILERIKKNEEKSERFPKDVFKEINDYLDTILNDFPKENETAWRNYTKGLASLPTMSFERKSAIQAFVREIFLDLNLSEIEAAIDPWLREREISEKNFKNKKGKWILPIFVDDIVYESFRGANYDLRLGENVYVSTERVPKKLRIAGKDVLPIEPGEFGILMTQEYLFVPPDLMGIISIRLTHKQKGLVNISGFHVDPGFYGRLMFSVFDAGPKDVMLRYKDQVFMIMFDELTELDETSKCPKSRWGGMDNIPVETLSGLSGSSVSVRKLDERIRRIEILLPVAITLFVGLLAAFIGWILSFPH